MVMFFQTELAERGLEVTDVILDEVPSLGIPAGIAMTAHVHRDHVIAR